MNWRGEKEMATVDIIGQKIGEFLRCYKKRLNSGGQSQGTSSQSSLTTAQEEDGDSASGNENLRTDNTNQPETCDGYACSACGFQGVIADHLRASKQCLDSLRRDPRFKMKASEAVFIVKASLLLTEAKSMQCPAESCPGGAHSPLPPPCLLWWKERGWTLMGWSGAGTNASSENIHEKISMFRRNMRRRNRATASEIAAANFQEGGNVEQQGATSRSQVAGCGRRLCDFCAHDGSLVQHLLSEEACLTAHLRRHLSHRMSKYKGRPKLAVFDLGIIGRFCSNPECEGDLEREGVLNHVGGACFEYYQTSGQQLFNWGNNPSAATIEARLKNRKATLKAQKTDTLGIQAYHHELDQTLKLNCSGCFIQGPLLSSQHHVIHGAGRNSSGSQSLWLCSQCVSNVEAHQDLVAQSVAKVKELGSPGEHDDTLKKMVVEVGDQGRRVIFVPAALVPDFEGPEIGDNLNPMTTTVLVPKNPEALEIIGDDALERAKKRKTSLDEVAEFFGRRHFFGPLTETLSVLHQSKMGKIRAERLTMLSNMKKFRKGKIISRDPNHAMITGRNPHYAETQKHCLTDTCSFSTAAIERRSLESSARAAVNGQVKLRVEITLLKNYACDSPLLRDIILGCCNSAPLISHAPTVLNYLRAKTKLLMKHIISPSYSNWDLDLRFAVDEWTVNLVGFLHCEEFDEVNQKIARGELSMRETASAILLHPQVLPTTALSAKRLKEEYGLSAERAQVRIIYLIFLGLQPAAFVLS